MFHFLLPIKSPCKGLQLLQEFSLDNSAFQFIFKQTLS